MHLSNRQLFLKHVAQTSPAPIGLEITRAEGIHLYDADGRAYIDFISGNSVSNIGHCHPAVVKAVQEQAATYMFLMVYGEYIQSPQVQLAKALSDHLPEALDTVYYVNSGAEAVEGALKLAKRATGRTEIICFRDAYHGSTHGALSVMGNEEFKQAFRPLLPGITILEYNSVEAVKAAISDKTAAVIVEPIASEKGYEPAGMEFMMAIRYACHKHGTLMILDEIQSGFGRSGSLFAFEHYHVVPDILCLAKGMGGGMPIGCFIGSQALLNTLTHDPVLGHINTFGGHPVSCAASLACLNTLVNENIVDTVVAKEKLIRGLLQHPKIKGIQGRGLMLSVGFESMEINMKVIEACIRRGLIVDWFLFNAWSMRVTPPLTITMEEIEKSCKIILEAINEVYST
ncbi:MAG: aspartate aminotransferase family protein [Bacteroidetes bacterium]|nr:aspartate aminotransferase family protein [Bacteroidota bacterium]